MQKRIAIGLVYFIWGVLFWAGFGRMIYVTRHTLIVLINSHFKVLKEALAAWQSGNMSVDHVIFLHWVIGILGFIAIGLTLIIIGSFFIWPGYKLPKVPLIFSLLFIVLFFDGIWTAIKYVAPNGILSSIVYALVLYYARYAGRQRIELGPEGKRSVVGKVRIWLFYFILAALIICSFIPIVLNLKLPEGVMVEID